MNNRFPLGSSRWAWCFSLAGFALLIDALKRHAAATELVLTGAGALAFAACFFLVLEAWKRGRSGTWQCIAVALIGALFAPFNAAAWVFFAVACALAPVVADGQARVASAIVAAIVATAFIEKLVFLLPWSFVGIVAGTGFPIAVMCTLTIRRSAAVRELASHGERERIARDLHDVLGQTLSVIILKIDLAVRLAPTDPERVVRELTDADRIARETLEEVRATLRGYRVRSLGHELELARHALTAAGILVSSQFASLELDSASESALCLALREGVTNVVRHAQAKHCHLAINVAHGQCVLTVEDDGVGWRTASARTPEDPGSGIEGMRERMAALGGSVTYTMGPGTALTVTVPLKAPESPATSAGNAG